MKTKFDNALSSFFRRPARSKISSLLKPYRDTEILRRPSIHMNNSLTRLKLNFYETEYAYFLIAKFDNVLSKFFRKPPKSKNNFRLEGTRAMTPLRRPSIYLHKSLTKLKITFYETAQAHFLRAKFNNVLSTFFL